MHVDIFQMIFDEIKLFVPKQFQKIVFYGENSAKHYCYEFYVLLQDGKWVKCYDIPGVELDDLLERFDAINDAVDTLKESNPVEHNWDIITIVITENYDFHADYTYKDEPFDKLEFEGIWKEKYLK